MKKLLSIMLMAMFMLTNISSCAFAIQDANNAKSASKKSMPKLEIAFVFDSNSEKTNQIVNTYKPIIAKSLSTDYQAVFSNDLIFKGNWDEASAVAAAKRALQSRARMIVSFGYWSSEYLKKNNKSKNVVTVDEFAIRGFSNEFFNPVQQSINDFVVFQNLVPNMGKTAILMNERVYKTKNNWNELARKGFKAKNCNIDFIIIPVNNDIEASVNKIPSDVGSVYVTQIYNLSSTERKTMYDMLNKRKLPTFSSMGKEDVLLGAMFGTSTKDLDKKLAEQISFSIKNVIKGGKPQSMKVNFVEDNSLFFNRDTAELIGYTPHIRLLKSVEVITNKKPELRDLSYMFNTFEERNLSVQRKKFLISAAKRSLTSAYLRYLPTLRLDLGYQTYNEDYAKSYSNVPTHVGQFTVGMDQVIYSPDLVTNIIVKHKKLNFDKAEKVLVEQNMGLEVAQLYIEYQMLKNRLNITKQYVDDLKNALAMAKIRQITGKCGKEETLRLAGEVNEAEKDLLLLTSDFEIVKYHMNQLLYSDQSVDFDLAPLTATDPAFFLKDISLIDYIRTPDKMDKFTKLTINEAIYLSPETTKLKAAIAMKKAEMGNYAQKFVLPSAKLSLEYGTQFDRSLPYEKVGHYQMATPAAMALGGSPWLNLDTTSGRFLIAAQWKPIEGGTKIAEIARCKSELNELNAYLEQINTEIELNIRSIINRAISKYLCIERSYKAMYAEEENLQLVKERYVTGKVTAPQMIDAINAAYKARIGAKNAQYEFYNELVWLQRGLVSVNWSHASKEAQGFITKLKTELEPQKDINVNL